MAGIENTRDAVIESAQTPVKNVFAVGPFGARVSFASQQRRAINLVWALCEEGVIERGTETDVAVVGGGIAGVTAAAALLSRGCNVAVIESDGALLGLQRAGHHRMVHPSINFWPNDNLEWTTSLPFLDWFAGSSVAVVKGVDREWRKYFAGRTSDINANTKVSGFRHNADTGKVTIEVGGAPFRDVDIVLVATGFGTEDDMGDACQDTYWSSDEIEQLAQRTGIKVAVSGTGDGGIIDVLRLIYPGFMENEVALHYLLLEDRKSLQDAVKKVEADAQTMTDLAARSEFYAERYAAFALSRSIDAKALLPDLIPGKNRPVLIGRLPQPFEISSAPIHKMILAYAMSKRHLDFVQGELKRKKAGGYYVRLDTGGTKSLASFEKVFVRHGAAPPIKGFFGEEEAAAIALRQKKIGDFLKIPDARLDYFDSELHPHRGPRHFAFVKDRLPMARRLLSDRFGLSAYIDAEDPTNFRYQAELVKDSPGDSSEPRRSLPDKIFGIELLDLPNFRIPEAAHLVARAR